MILLGLGCLGEVPGSDESPETEVGEEPTAPSNSELDASGGSSSPPMADAMADDSPMGFSPSMPELMSPSGLDPATDDGPLMSLLSDINSIGEEGVYSGMTLAHNLIRAELNEGTPLPALQWDTDLSAYAQQWSDELATRCNSIEHRNQNRYGENIAMRGARPGPVTFPAEDAVNGWAAEIACWQFGTIVGGGSEGGAPGQESCDLQCANDLFANGCGHYTQLVWRNSERVGCGYSTCEADGFDFGIWVCNYDPPGNFIGQAPY